jgi:hypothetical protein
MYIIGRFLQIYMTKLRKIFVSSIMVMTVVVMSGLTAPMAAKASVEAGDLIKRADMSAVYYLGADEKRYVFPNEATFKSWYSDFSGVVTISSEELASYPLGANVVVRPGTKLVKITTDPKVYAVEADGTLRWVQTEEDAIALYGADWASRVIDVADSFFTNYTIGDPLESDEVPAGTLLQKDGEADVYYYDGEDYRLVEDEVAFLANRFQYDNVLTYDDFTPSGTAITSSEDDITNTAQSGQAVGVQPGVGTGLTVSLNANTPVAQIIPYNVQGQVYTSVDLTASNDGDVELTGLDIKRTGLGYADNFDKVYVEVDGTRHGNKRSLGSDNISNLYFSTDSSKITIPAGETVTVDIVADMQDYESNSGSNALSIIGASSFDTTADVSGSFPITGNAMSISNIKSPTAELTISKDTGDVYLGDEQVKVAEFNLENTSTSTNEHISFTEITLDNKASADNDEVINYTLYNDSDEVVSSSVNTNSNDMIKFTLDEAIEIEDGDIETFVVKADIYDGRTESVALVLDEITDVKAVGLDNGFNVSVTDATIFDTSSFDIYDGSSGDYGYYINGGDLNFTEADSNPGSVEVVPRDEDVLFLAAEIEALEEMMTINSMKFDFNTMSGTLDSLEDVTLYLDGQVVAGPIDGADPLEFDEEFEVSGTQLLEVKADIADDASSGDYAVNLSTQSGYVLAEDEEGDSVHEDKIKGSVNGGTITVSTGEFTLSKDGTYGGRDVVPGSDDLLVGQYILEVGDAEGAKVDKYTVDVAVNDDFELGNIEELYISEDTDVITNVLGSNDFNVNQELSAGETKVIKVYVSVDDNFDAVGSNDTLITSLTVEGEGLVSTEVLKEGPIQGQKMTFEEGNLTEAVSAGTPDSDIVIAGTNDIKVAEWEFESANTPYTLRDVEIKVYTYKAVQTLTVEEASDTAFDLVVPTLTDSETISISGADVSSTSTLAADIADETYDDWTADSNGGVVTFTANEPGTWALTPITHNSSDEITQELDSYDLEKEEALITSATLNGETANVINGVVTFDNEITVEKDAKKKLELYANFNGDFNSIRSGDIANFAITSYESKAGNENTYTLVEVTDGSLLTNELMYTRNAIPTIVATAGETANLSRTDNKVMDISITADGDDITINKIGIEIYTNVASTTGDTMTVEILDSNGDVVGATADIDGHGNADTNWNKAHDISWSGEVIADGETEVYTVSVSFSEAPTADKMLEVTLVEDHFSWNDGKEDITYLVNQAEIGLLEDLSGNFEIDNK